MVVVGIAIVIALVVAFLLLERRADARLGNAQLVDAEQPKPAAQESEAPERDVYRVEHNVYEELYSSRSGDVSRRRPGPHAS